MSEKVYHVTEEGLKKLQEEYDHLIHVVRQEVKKELADARALGDLSENADLDAAKERQATVESRIVELERQLRNYELIDTKKGSKKKVSLGATVKIQFLDNKEKDSFQILGSSEANPLQNIISNESPLGAALIDAKVGDTVVVNTEKPYKVTILEISYPENK